MEIKNHILFTSCSFASCLIEVVGCLLLKLANPVLHKTPTTHTYAMQDKNQTLTRIFPQHINGANLF